MRTISGCASEAGPQTSSPRLTPGEQPSATSVPPIFANSSSKVGSAVRNAGSVSLQARISAAHTLHDHLPRQRLPRCQAFDQGTATGRRTLLGSTLNFRTPAPGSAPSQMAWCDVQAFAGASDGSIGASDLLDLLDLRLDAGRGAVKAHVELRASWLGAAVAFR